MLSLALNYAVHGTDATGYQVTNLLLFIACIIIVYVLVRNLTGDLKMSFFVALLFALHPIHVESVCRITERKDLMYGLFFLVSVYFYIKYIDHGYKIRALVFVTFFFILSLLSKAQAVALPLVLLLVDYYKDRKIGSGRLWTEKIHLILLSVLFGFLTFKAQLYTGYLNEFPGMLWYEPFLHACQVLSLYVYRIIVPLGLSPHYPYPYIPGEAIPSVMLLYLLIIPAIAGLLVFFRRNKTVIFGILFYIITVFIMLRAIPVADNFSPDRYNFIPSLGLFFIAGYLFVKISNRFKKAATGILVVYSLMLFMITFNLTNVWHDGQSVWNRVLKKYPENIPAIQNLAEFQMRENNAQKALELYKKILQKDRSNTHTNYFLAQYLSSRNKPDDLKILYNDLIKNNFVKAADFNNMALISSVAGDNNKTPEYLLKSLKVNPDQPKTWLNLAGFYAMQNQFSISWQLYKYCMKYPVFWRSELYFLCAKAMLAGGQPGESKTWIDKACRLQPKNEIYRNMENLINTVIAEYEPEMIIDSLHASKKAIYFMAPGTYYYAIPYLKWLLAKYPGEEKYRNSLGECIALSGRTADEIPFIKANNLYANTFIQKEYSKVKEIAIVLRANASK